MCQGEGDHGAFPLATIVVAAAGQSRVTVPLVGSSGYVSAAVVS